MVTCSSCFSLLRCQAVTLAGPGSRVSWYQDNLGKMLMFLAFWADQMDRAISFLASAWTAPACQHTPLPCTFMCTVFRACWHCLGSLRLGVPSVDMQMRHHSLPMYIAHSHSAEASLTHDTRHLSLSHCYESLCMHGGCCMERSCSNVGHCRMYVTCMR